MPNREQNSNKGTFGKVLNVSGCNNYIGAPFLSTKAILKIGAGYACLATDDNIIKTVSAMLPEAVYLSPTKAYDKLKDFNVLLIGCGLGTTFSAKNIFKLFINGVLDKDIPVIIDADGLNILSEIKNFSLPQKLILTPHPMEASRLLHVDISEILNNLSNSAKAITEKYNCITVLKSHETIVCSRDNTYVNKHGNSALAKAGTGDVLAGIIAGLTAQKMDLFEACKLGVYLHSRAGEIASKELTEYSVLASDLMNYLPRAIFEIL